MSGLVPPSLAGLAAPKSDAKTAATFWEDDVKGRMTYEPTAPLPPKSKTAKKKRGPSDDEEKDPSFRDKSPRKAAKKKRAPDDEEKDPSFHPKTTRKTTSKAKARAPSKKVKSTKDKDSPMGKNEEQSMSGSRTRRSSSRDSQDAVRRKKARVRSPTPMPSGRDGSSARDSLAEEQKRDSAVASASDGKPSKAAGPDVKERSTPQSAVAPAVNRHSASSSTSQNGRVKPGAPASPVPGSTAPDSVVGQSAFEPAPADVNSGPGVLNDQVMKIVQDTGDLVDHEMEDAEGLVDPIPQEENVAQDHPTEPSDADARHFKIDDKDHQVYGSYPEGSSPSAVAEGGPSRQGRGNLPQDGGPTGEGNAALEGAYAAPRDARASLRGLDEQSLALDALGMQLGGKDFDLFEPPSPSRVRSNPPLGPGIDMQSLREGLEIDA